MKASSREAWDGVSSKRGMPWAAAVRPMCSAVVPRISSAPAVSRKSTPGARSRVVRASGSGVTTRTVAAPESRTKSATVVSARRRPRPMTIRWSAVRAISLIRWEETRTVRPSAARDLRRVRIQRTPSGSRPLTGSSRTRVAGSPSNAAAMPRRWPMPREKPLTRRSATSVRPVRSRTSSTRRLGRPWVRARPRRWWRAVRPGWTERASSRAPTSVRARGGRRGAAADGDPARRRGVQAEDHPHGGGLAGAVRAEEAGHGAGTDGEGQVVDGRPSVPAAVAFGEVLRGHHGSMLVGAGAAGVGRRPYFR